jgi:hypothetical protein
MESARAPAKHRKQHLLFDGLVIVAIAGLVLGVSDIFGAGSFSGLCLAFGAIFFGLAYILKLLHKAEEAAEKWPRSEPKDDHPA